MTPRFGWTRVTTPPAVEPVVLAEAKDWLRVEQSVTADNTLIEGLITQAREWAERETGLKLITQTVTQTLDRWPSDRTSDYLPDEGRIADVLNGNVRWVELIDNPVQSITSVTVYADDDTPTVWGAANYRLASARNGRSRLAPRANAAWPSATRSPDGIEIVYVAGFGNAGSSVPRPIRNAILTLVAGYYENRGECSKAEADPRVHDLLRPYRFLTL